MCALNTYYDKLDDEWPIIKTIRQSDRHDIHYNYSACIFILLELEDQTQYDLMIKSSFYKIYCGTTGQ